MSSASPKRIVINSHRFFRDISPAVFQELDSGDDDAESILSSLYSAIKNGGHKIVLTRKIREEYDREAVSEGFNEILIETVVNHLQTQNLVINPRLPGGRKTFAHVPKYHKAFLDDAIDAKADYFVTERNVWLSRSNVIAEAYDVTIIKPDDFIHLESI